MINSNPRWRVLAQQVATAAWPLFLFVVAAAVFGRTLAPTVTWSHDGADGGDLIAAAASTGVPHPSGYPTYVLLARLFLQTLPFAEPAVRVHWLSALSAAATVMLLGLSVIESIRSGRWSAGRGTAILPSGASGSQRVWSGRLPVWLRAVVASSAALIFAFSPLLWSQATIAEVHALNVAFVALVLWLLMRWWGRRSSWVAATLVFLYGICLGNHLTGLLLLPLVLLWLLDYGRRNHLTGRGWSSVAAGFLLGLAVYGYLPLAAARQPPINWGDPQTWDRFWWLVTGRLYQEAVFGVDLLLIPGRLSAWASLLLAQFGWWGWVLALIGLWRLSRQDRRVLRASIFVFAAFSVYGLCYDRADSYVYLLPACLLGGFWLGHGLMAVTEVVWHWAVGTTAQSNLPVASPIAVLSLALLPLFPLVGNFAAQDLRQDRGAAEYAAAALEVVEPGGLIISSGDRTTFALWYRRYALAERDDVAIVNAGLWEFDWYRRTLATHHPSVALPDGTAAPPEFAKLVAANLRHRSVYVTEEAKGLVEGHLLTPVGPLHKLGPYRGDS